MAPELKLTYFDMRGRAEPIRLAMVIGKVPFEDERLSFEQYREVRPKLPLGSVPTLAVDGKVMLQSFAILRYVGKLGGLYPEDPKQALIVDEVIDDLNDFHMNIYRYRGKDKDLQRESREKLVKEDLPRYWGGTEKRLEGFGSGPFVLGDKVSIADLCVVGIFLTFKCGILDYVETDALDAYPRLLKVYESVMELPEVVEWYKKHPVPGVTA